MVTDSSIRPTHQGYIGMEFVSPVLCGGGIDQIRVVCDVLRKYRAKVNTSCGTHVHLNVWNLPNNGMFRLVRFYARYESVIDSWLGYSRRGSVNRYCQSLLFAPTTMSFLRSFATSGPIRLLNSSSRYYKVNTHAFQKYSTFEFRQHHATLKVCELTHWITFLQGLAKWAGSSTPEPPQSTTLRAFNERTDLLQADPLGENLRPCVTDPLTMSTLESELSGFVPESTLMFYRARYEQLRDTGIWSRATR